LERHHDRQANIHPGRLTGTHCIRLFNDDIKDLFERVPIETRVIVIG